MAVHGRADPRGRSHVELLFDKKGKPAGSGQSLNCLILPWLPFSGPDEATSHLNDTQVLAPVRDLGPRQTFEVPPDVGRSSEPAAL
eukprot:1796309-Heterocapsa_arctica.AAC.1